MKMTEIISKSPAQLAEALVALRREQMNLRFQKAAGQLANPNRWREVRVAVARVKTQLNLAQIAKTLNKAEAK